MVALWERVSIGGGHGGSCGAASFRREGDAGGRGPGLLFGLHYDPAAPPGGIVFSGLIVPGGLGGWAVPCLGFIRLLCIDVVLVGVDLVFLGGVG